MDREIIITVDDNPEYKKRKGFWSDERKGDEVYEYFISMNDGIKEYYLLSVHYMPLGKLISLFNENSTYIKKNKKKKK